MLYRLALLAIRFREVGMRAISSLCWGVQLFDEMSVADVDGLMALVEVSFG